MSKDKSKYQGRKINKIQPEKIEEKKKQKPTYLMAKSHKWLPLVYAFLFALFAYYMLAIKNADYLFAVQERSLFLFDKSYFDTIMVKPGALMTYLGCFFTQFFYHPELGSCMLVAIWLVTYFLTIKAFKLNGFWSCLALLPIGALLCSETILGYWIYYNKELGYWFSQSIGLLINMFAIWFCHIIRNKDKRKELIYIAIWAVIGYLATGWLGLLATIIMGISNITKNPKTRILPILIAIVFIITTPIISYQFYTQMRIEDAWIIGLPIFQIDAYISEIPIIPFIIMGIVLILLSVINFDLDQTQIKKNSLTAWGLICLQFICLATIIAGDLKANVGDYNYHAELRIYRAVEEDRWQDALDEIAACPKAPTREIVMFKNLALTYQGKLGDYLFKYNNLSTDPVVYDSMRIHMVQTCAPLVYLHYARMNFATRWSIENAVEYGFCPNIYKILTTAALVSGEYDLAKKYINILKKTLYYKEWAEQHEPMLKNHKLIVESAETANMVEYYDHFSNRMDSDEGLLEMYLMNYFSHTMNKDSKLLQETTLAYSLINKDIQLFWPRFFLYAHLHEGETMPIHYQEAAYLYGNLEHSVDISKMPFDQDKIIQRYAAFNQLSNSLLQQGKTSEQIGEEMKLSFGDTFWWFYFFCRGVESY